MSWKWKCTANVTARARRFEGKKGNNSITRTCTKEKSEAEVKLKTAMRTHLSERHVFARTKTKNIEKKMECQKTKCRAKEKRERTTTRKTSKTRFCTQHLWVQVTWLKTASKHETWTFMEDFDLHSLQTLPPTQHKAQQIGAQSKTTDKSGVQLVFTVSLVMQDCAQLHLSGFRLTTARVTGAITPVCRARLFQTDTT